MNLSEWLKEPVPVDCITTVMLKILDGKCKMLPEEKLLMADLYDQIKHLNVTLLPADIHQLILQAREGMDEFLQTVYPQMRLVTVLEACIEVLNGLLVFSMAVLSIYLWTQQIATPGDIAVAISLCLRLNGISHWIMWEVASLFENMEKSSRKEGDGFVESEKKMILLLQFQEIIM